MNIYRFVGWKYLGVSLLQYNLNHSLDYFNNPKFVKEFDGSCFKTDSAGFNYNIINLYITYEMMMVLC